MKNQARTWKVVVLLAFLSGSLSSCRSRAQEVHPNQAAKLDPNLDVKLKTWQIAFEDQGSIYLSKGDFKNKKLLIKNGMYPAWSPGGRYLAYWQNDKVYVKDYHTSKIYFVCAVRKGDIEDTDWKLEFDKNETFLFVPKEGRIQVYDFVNPQYSQAAMAGGLRWIEAVPTMSLSGKHLAFTRNGDIWISEKKNGQASPSILVGGSCYYDAARRVAPLAYYHDGEGASASTPYLVNELVWLDETHVWYHIHRYGGSGDTPMGVMTLKDDPDQDTTITKAIKIGGIVFSPRICPDNKTLTLMMHDDLGDGDFCLYVVDREAKPIKKFKGIFLEHYAWRPVGKDVEPTVLPKEPS